MRSLAERLDSTAEAWQPKEGDTVIGTVLGLDERTTEFGTYPIVTLATEDGPEIAVHGFHTVLKREFARRPPVEGERLGIKYLGKSPKGYEGYRVVFEETRAPDWNRIGVEAQAEAAVADIDGEKVPETSTEMDPQSGDGPIPF